MNNVAEAGRSLKKSSERTGTSSQRGPKAVRLAGRQRQASALSPLLRALLEDALRGAAEYVNGYSAGRGAE